MVKEAVLVDKKYEKDILLFEKKLISELELGNSESNYLQQKYALENAETAIIHNDLQLSKSQNTVLELNHQHQEREDELTLSLQESFKQLQSQLAIWEQKYILKAPTEGYVSFYKYWSDNQYVHIGDEVMTVVPKSKDIIGKVYLPGYGSGKVKIGQKVNIKFDNYPYSEFGVVQGRIAAISLIAHDNQYLVDVRLIQGLQTSYDETLEFKQEMQGTADIITDELRLFERIFNKLRYFFSSAT
ncbi:HlyD family efflux transporter periplasmic adaptor subunit [candidate division KSB1 bacterium]|nr:HlyD family efflux transporter periplasmic adaptor subunit [candidate division KSB1 bacterium]